MTDKQIATYCDDVKQTALKQFYKIQNQRKEISILHKKCVRQQAELEIQSQNFNVLVSDHRCLQQSFDNLKGLYQAEKEKVESAKSKSIYFAKELQKARAEINRVTALAAEWKDAAYTYADNIDKIKAEAIKEFAEKLKKKKNTVCAGHGITTYAVEEYDIDCLLKEMVGDTE
jgi:predicted Zn-dependent peptidase